MTSDQVFLRWSTLCIFTISAILISVPSFGATFCVNTATELQSALTTAASNGEDNTIKIVQGKYEGNFVYASTEGYSLTVEGGYTEGFTSQEIDPANTILDGGGTDTVMALVSQKEANFSVEGLTLRNGKANTVDYGGVYLGGGLYVRTEGMLKLINDIFFNNRAGVGAGAYIISDCILSYNTFDKNAADDVGGGIFIERHSAAIYYNIFSANSAKSRGGGAFINGSSTMSYNTFSENFAGSHGGGVFGTRIESANNTFKWNISNGYGGGGSFFLSHSTSDKFIENSALSGGGIFLRGHGITKGFFYLNSAINSGGGVYLEEGGNCAENSIIKNSAGKSGGGVYARGSANLNKNIFFENTASEYGGGISGGFILTDNFFSGNMAKLDCGGAFRSNTLTNNTFLKNIAEGNGGGACLSENLTNNTFLKNIANGNGGGVFQSENMTNNIFSENSAKGNGGGVYNYNYNNGIWLNNTFSDNNAENQGGGIWIKLAEDRQTFSLFNNIFWKNSAPDASSIYLDNESTDPFFPIPVDMFNNNFDQSQSGIYMTFPFVINDSNLNNVDPLFVGNINYHLTSSSPCIDVGYNNALGLLKTDKDGNPRIVGSTVDMGAYEYNEKAPIADAGNDQTVDAGTTVRLDGSNSSDPGSESLSYYWKQIAGEIVTLSEPTADQPEFKAPSTNIYGKIIFELSVINTSGLINTDWVAIDILWDGIVFVEPDGQCGGNEPCYSEIQNGVDSDAIIATIRVGAGSYVENIELNKSITLEIGWNPDFTTLSQPVPVVLRAASLVELGCNPSNDHCYRLYNYAMTPDEAEDYADQDGGYLATITSASEGQWLYETFGTDLIDYGTRIFGASDSDLEEDWQWLSGENWSYMNWNSGEPNNWNDNEDCIALSSHLNPGNGYAWNDVNCGNKYVSLIEYDFDPEP